MTAELTVRPRGEVRIERAIVIRREAQEVFDRVSDFRWASQWRSGVRVSTQQPPGPMVVGSRLHEEASVLGRQVITDSVVDTFEPGRSWTFRQESGPIPVRGGFAVAAVPGGTELTYTLVAQLRGSWRAAAPWLRWSAPRMIARSLETLRSRLEVVG